MLDIGAHDGSDALAFAEHSGHRVYSFEPSPSKVARVRESFAASNLAPLLTLYPMALSNASGTVDFWVKAMLPGQQGALSSTQGSQQDMLSKPEGPATRVEVESGRLDSVVGPWQSVLHAKVDAQGHDAEVIFGAEALIASHRLRVLAFEVAPGLGEISAYVKAVMMLSQHHFQCYQCDSHAHQLAIRSPQELHGHLTRLRNQKFNLSILHTGWGVHSGFTDFVCVSLRATHQSLAFT